MKVLNIVTNGLRREGISTTQLEYARFLDRTKIQYTMAAFDQEFEPQMVQAFQERGCEILYLPSRKHGGKLGLLKYAQALYKAMKQNHYDAVHVHGSSAIMAVELLAAKAAGIPIRIAHSRNTTCSHKKADKLLLPVFDRSYTAAFSCGEEAGKWLFGDKPFTIIHNGKDLDKFQFDPERRTAVRIQYGLGDTLTVGFVGNLNEQKNPEYLLNIFGEIQKLRPDTTFFVIGDGSKREQLEHQAKALELNHIFFTGRVSNVHELLQGMDVMLLPSKWEGLPNVVLEWQAAGLYCLVSDQVSRECALTELVTFLPIDVEPSVWAEEAVKRPVEGREERCRTARTKMEAAGFDIRQNALVLEQLYQKLLESN